MNEIELSSSTLAFFGQHALVRTEEGIWIILNKAGKIVWSEPQS